MLDAADWERANKEFKIPQPSIIGRILCCPTPPSKLKDGAYFEEPEKVTTDWLKPFVRTALDVNIDGEDDNVPRNQQDRVSAPGNLLRPGLLAGGRRARELLHARSQRV